MRYLIILFILIVFLLFVFYFIPLKITYISPKTAEASSLTITEIIEKHADQFGVNRELALKIAFKESSLNPNAVGDMNITCRRTGEPVRARGLYQITECYWPNITDDQAFDPEWSTRWAMKQFKDGNCKRFWTTCRS